MTYSHKHLFLIDVRDENFYRMLPANLRPKSSDESRVQVMAFPPLGIQTLAPVMRQQGHRVRLFDTCHPEMKTANVCAAMKQDNPNVVGLSFLSATTYPSVKAMARSLKQIAPSVPIIVGGPFATMNAEKIMGDCADIDCVGVGEGEDLLSDYLKNMDNCGAVSGLVWRQKDQIVKNTPRPLIRDLDAYPFPDRTSLPIDYIESLPLDVPAVLSLDKFCTVQTSRGCPYHCIYCDIPSISEGKWRCRSASNVLEELQQLDDQGYRSIYLTDDHFLVRRERINEICTGMIKRKFSFRWGCEGRVDSAAVDQLPIMKQANCDMLAFGVEAGTQKVLDRLNKRQTLAQVEQAVAKAKEHGIERVHGFFVIGSPEETAPEIMESFRFAARLELDTFGFNRLCVYRGTPLWQEYVDRGIINDNLDWHKWFKCSDIDPTVLPGEVLNRLRMKGYAYLFAHRILHRPLRTLHLLKTFGRHMKVSDILSLLASPFRRRSLTKKPDITAEMTEPKPVQDLPRKS